ncbi:hypothetical protein [Candidatus Formimonas warabiya]|uniref:hypothetical protein n=1 Tax=Formimonas warabiya TaxID=1761012 RepID=UPI001BE3E071|nr:hypothetical protein [Candidatus Formimonas warabiya]
MSKRKQEKITAPLNLTQELEGSIPKVNLDGVSEARIPTKIVPEKTPPSKK